MKKMSIVNLETNVETLLELVEFNGSNKVWARVTSVARSGMSRWIHFELANRQSIDWLFGKILNRRTGIKGIFIPGAGMDMIFATILDVNQTIKKCNPYITTDCLDVNYKRMI